MDFAAYQRKALLTDQTPTADDAEGDTSIIVPLLGIAGEAGELLTEYKKHLRDAKSHLLFQDRVAEELGDLLWYISNVATKFNLDLNEIAQQNLEKTEERWLLKANNEHFDADFPEQERLPRSFEVELVETIVDQKSIIRTYVDGKKIGNDLTDSAYNSDGYSFHDVFHFAHTAVLGWSPLTRALLKKKRKSSATVDEVEDGGRAIAIEEGVSALIFDYARQHNFLENVKSIDYSLLRSLKGITSHLEVKSRSLADWQKAILEGYAVWREVVKNRGGKIKVDMDRRQIVYLGQNSENTGIETKNLSLTR